jgi:hypothetical protein
MRKKILWFIPPLVILIVILVFLLGREKPPIREVENAERAMAEARQKEADIYVPDIFSKAEESLKRAKDLMKEKKYKEAKKAAEETVHLAGQAISQVEPNKSKMKAQAEQMISDIRAEIEKLKGLVAKPSRRMTKRERKELEGMIQKWEKEVQNIETMIGAQKIRQAHDQLDALKKEVHSRYERFIPSHEEAKGIK